LQPEFVENIIRTQAEILDKYASLVKKNGKLVYATCSILPSENENQVQQFLAKHPEFNFVKEKKVSAAKSGFDGFYMALMERVD
jgi:16S rRNA (cytosine967-C5)-methyltransferase